MLTSDINTIGIKTHVIEQNIANLLIAMNKTSGWYFIWLR